MFVWTYNRRRHWRRDLMHHLLQSYAIIGCHIVLLRIRSHSILKCIELLSFPLLLFLWKECLRSLLVIKPSAPFCPQFVPDHNWWKIRQITSLIVYSHLWYAVYVTVILVNFSCWITDFKRLRRICGILKFEWKSVNIQGIFWVGFLDAGNAQFQNLSSFLSWDEDQVLVNTGEHSLNC